MMSNAPSIDDPPLLHFPIEEGWGHGHGSASGILVPDWFNTPFAQSGSGNLNGLLNLTVSQEEAERRTQETLDFVKIFSRVKNPTTLEESLAVAVLKGDQAAALALVDRIIEERDVDTPTESATGPRRRRRHRHAKHRKQKKEAVPYEIRQLVYNRDDFRCYRCGRKVAAGSKRKRRGLPLATIDHYLPRCAGGTNDVANLKTCCKTCNERKGGRIPKEFKQSPPEEVIPKCL